MNPVVYTIGHSTHSIGKLINLLSNHRISAVVDVRSQPYSRTNPQFNKEILQKNLHTAGMSYVFLGRELGARAEDSSFYIGGKVQYPRLAGSGSFLKGIQRILTGANDYQIALLCAEKDPLRCHRTILIGRHLVDRGIRLLHILESGEVESNEVAISRLLRELRMSETDLVRSYDEIVAEAYDRRANEIAYILPDYLKERTSKGQDR